jgi:hypothetical protein
VHFLVGNSSPGAGSEENYSSSNDTDTRDTEAINSVALPDCHAAGSESDEDAITQECYRIFQEYEPQQSHHTVSKVNMKVPEWCLMGCYTMWLL